MADTINVANRSAAIRRKPFSFNSPADRFGKASAMESLRQLKHVIALAEHRHFGRAAMAAGITQAALTLSIQKLEAAYGVPLFERRKGEVVITHYGEIVLEAAEAMSKRLKNMRRELTLTRKLAAGRLMVGCDPHFAESLMAPALAKLMKEHPHLEFTIENGKWSQMREHLLAKEIDLFVGFEIEGQDPLLLVENHKIPPFVVFCSKSHPILQVETPGILDCIGYPIVIPPTTRWLQARILPIVTDAGVTTRIPAYLFTSDYGIIRRFVRDNGALGFGQLRDIQYEISAGEFEFFTLRELNEEVTLSIANLERRSLPVATQELMQAIRKEVTLMQQEWAARPDSL